MPQPSHQDEQQDEATVSSIGMNATSAVADSFGQPQNHNASQNDHVEARPHAGGVLESPTNDASNGIQHDMRRNDHLNQRTQEDTQMHTGQFSRRNRLPEDERAERDMSTSTDPLFNPTIEEDSSTDQECFLIQTIQRALEVAETDECELSMSAQQLLFSSSTSEIDCTGADNTGTDSYTCADDLTFDS